MVAGIENLGEGLLKGYQFGLQQQRQQQQDARQATLDQQNQEQHNLSMQANQFNLDQAKKKATLDEATQSRTLNFNKTLQQAVLMNKSGNKQGAFTALVQGNNNDPQATHNIEFLGLDDSGMGSIRYIDKATGKAIGDGKISAEDAIVMFHQTLDPAKAFADELAKKEEERKDTRKRALDLSTKIAEEKRAQQYRLEQIRTEKKTQPPKQPRYEVRQNPETGVFERFNVDTGEVIEFTKDGKPFVGEVKNNYGTTYILKQADGVLTPAQADLLVNKIRQQVDTIGKTDNPSVKIAAFNEIFKEAKGFAAKTLPQGTVAEQEIYAKNFTARQFGNGNRSYDDLYKEIYKKNNPKPSTSLSGANQAVTPSNTQSTQPKIITGLNGGLTKDKAVNSFLMGQ